MPNPKDRPAAPNARPTPPLPAGCPISNRNTTAFKIRRNSHKTQYIAFSNRNISPALAISFSSPIPPPTAPPVPLFSVFTFSISRHFYSEHINSRNQVNSMKTNAERVFYLEHLNTLGNVSSQNPPSSFSSLTFPVSVSCDFSPSAISNRQWLARLETMSNPYKTKAGDEF
jgi:hypothetical protein